MTNELRFTIPRYLFLFIVFTRIPSRFSIEETNSFSIELIISFPFSVGIYTFDLISPLKVLDSSIFFSLRECRIVYTELWFINTWYCMNISFTISCPHIGCILSIERIIISRFVLTKLSISDSLSNSESEYRVLDSWFDCN